MRSARIVVVLILLAGAAPAAAPACGCGALVPAGPDGGGAGATEWSLVTFDGATETILMRLSLGQPLDAAALVLPVRPGATVGLGSDAAFAHVSAMTAPRTESRTRYHLGFADGRGALDGATAGAPGSGTGGGVRVLGAQALGPLQVVTLRSRSAAALEDWLRVNGYPLPDGLAAGTQAYLDAGWDLVVAKLRPEAAGIPLAELQPLEIRFPATRAVYPLRLSRLADGGSSARVDLFAPWPVAVGGYGTVARERPGRAGGPGAALIFAGAVGAADRGALPAGTPPYLTSYRFTIAPGSPDRDPAFSRAPDARPYRQVRIVYEDVYLGGTILPVGLLLAAGAAAGVWYRRRHASAATDAPDA